MSDLFHLDRLPAVLEQRGDARSSLYLTPLSGVSPYLLSPPESAIRALPEHPSARPGLRDALAGVQAKLPAIQGCTV